GCMGSRKDGPLYRCADTALVRAARSSRLRLPAWPDLTDDTPDCEVRWQTWLRDVWSLSEAADSIEQASPLLAQQVQTLCSVASPETRQLRRAVVSVMRYLLRMTGRATPNGLFAGIASARSEEHTSELQSRENLVCRLLLEKKKKNSD